jgi:hypothetical protein
MQSAVFFTNQDMIQFNIWLGITHTNSPMYGWEANATPTQQYTKLYPDIKRRHENHHGPCVVTTCSGQLPARIVIFPDGKIIHGEVLIQSTFRDVVFDVLEGNTEAIDSGRTRTICNTYPRL